MINFQYLLEDKKIKREELRRVFSKIIGIPVTEIKLKDELNFDMSNESMRGIGSDHNFFNHENHLKKDYLLKAKHHFEVVNKLEVRVDNVLRDVSTELMSTSKNRSNARSL